MKTGLAICVFILTVGCSIDFEDINHTVYEIEGGNTLVLNNDVKVKLIGIAGSEESQRYLEEHVLGQQIKVQFDRSNYVEVDESTKEIYAYVITRNKRSINGSLLKEGLTALDKNYLTDSLQAYRQYDTGPVATITEKEVVQQKLPQPTPKKATEDLPATSTRFTDLVARAERCVFVVYNQDQLGNTTGLGTGFFLSADGIAMSNYHVFENGSTWYIKTSDNRQYKVEEIIEHNKTLDYIVFRVGSRNSTFPFLNLVNTAPLKGTDIFVIGNPRGLEVTLTRGIVSAIREYRGYEEALVQIDAAISPGSSGSPVMNMEGKVIGMATMQLQDCENCNFAISAKVLHSLISVDY